MKNESGFVLADALVALLICSLFLTSFLSLNTTSLRAVGQGHNRLVASYIARAVIEDPSIRESEGDFVVDGKSFHWSRTSTDRTVAETDRIVVSDLEVDVTWNTFSGAASSITAKTVRLRSLDHEG